MLPTPHKSVSIFLIGLGLLAFGGSAQGQTVEGSVDGFGKDHIVVDGTRFSVDDKTRVKVLPSQDPDDFGLEVIARHPRGMDKAGEWVRFAPSILRDVRRARVTGTGRLAEEVQLLPHKAEGGGNEE